MTITFCLRHQNQEIQVDLEERDEETLTNLKWQELYQTAQTNNLPYYWLSAAIVKNKNKLQASCYDGSSLDKLQKKNNNNNNNNLTDPLTRLPILAIYHLFFNCFELSASEDPLLTKPLVTPKLSSFVFDDLGTQQIIDCAKASLNALVDSSSLTIKKQVGKIQYIVGNKLLKSSSDNSNKIEAARWLVSSSKHGISQATELLNNQ